jgi:hypothetical protein
VAIHQETLDRDVVRHAVHEAARELRRDDLVMRTQACEALGIDTPEWSACRNALTEELDEAEDWIERESAITDSGVEAPPVDSQTDGEFMPSHPTLALVQSALDEALDEGPFSRFRPRDPRWLSVLYQRLRARARGKAPFVLHRHPGDFQHVLPDRCTVALVSDWGTGNAHARAVGEQIRRCAPQHVIHLGDVYYAGTPREVQRNFLDVWKEVGPPAARYWSLNANHDMYSGGYGYFGHLLPAFGQRASYFSLQNGHWRLVGLDSAYVNGSLAPEQLPWLDAQLTGRERSIVLTHHHLLSPFRKRGDRLEESLDRFMASGRIFGWFWGHEHHLFEFADHRGVKCRCIGHGSLPYVPPDRRPQRHPAEIVRMETRSSPASPDRGIHGFALLRFDGPALHIEYIDEEGGTAWAERWE